MRATLWDGNKQLEGDLDFKESSISFRLIDFELTNLNFELAYSSIVKVRLYNIYKLSVGGVEIESSDGRRNVFVVDHAEDLKKKVHSKMKLRSI